MSNQIFNKVILFSLLLTISQLATSKSYAQEYSFSEIKEIILRERPQIGDSLLRETCFSSLDDLILDTYPPLHPDTEGFFSFMMEKTIMEIESEVVTEGATIWQSYNHGFIVKTPSVTFGMDLYDYFDTNVFFELANLIDVYFISHRHSDHHSIGLIGAMNFLNKPIVGPAEYNQVSIGMNAGESMVIADLTVIAHDGLHSVPVRQFEIITQEGLRFLHTGDNQDTENLPDISDVDVMMLNAWINDSGEQSHIETIPIAIDLINPIVTLPGHILELGHLGSHHAPILYHDIYGVDGGTLTSDYHVLAYGERYHYGSSTNDSIRSNTVENLSYEVLSDSIFIYWNTPQPASDGDTASFYRVIVDDSNDFMLTERSYFHLWDTLRSYNFKIYAYDDCGNQSENYGEINAEISDSYLRLSPRETLADIGQVDTVDVVVDNVVNLGNFQFDIIYDTEVIQVDTVLMGAFLGSTGRYISIIGPAIDNGTSPGRLSFGGISSGADPGPDGSGVLATITFNTQAYGNTTLELENVMLSDIDAQTITTNPISGYVLVSPSSSLWSTQISGTVASLNCVSAVSDLVAWAAGEYNTILRTNDGGNTWSEIEGFPDTLNINFYTIEALDDNTAFVGGQTNISTQMFRTDDGGLSWIKVFEQTGNWLQDITMFNQAEGFAIGSQSGGVCTILETIDGGYTWVQIADAPVANEGEHPFFTSVDWVDESACWFGTSESRAFHTTDGGISWEVVEIPPIQNVVSIAFGQASNGLAASNNSIAKTSDNGDNWELILPPVFGTIRHIVNHQDNYWVMIDESIYMSENNGLNWEWQTSTGEDLQYFSFVKDQGANSGWCVGANGSILKYENIITRNNNDKEVNIPKQYSLHQNYPNPFNPMTTINYELSAQSTVKLTIHDIRGQEVVTLQDEAKPPGYYQMQWNGKNHSGNPVSTGVYFCRLQSDNFSETIKMVLLK
ncbi:MAG: T9SS type A sorting domain-containing protein [Candidatus Marinimicrobia bacterium]|nr:T9SS type A sorting domain-containing protein [Candidatus Neomarinimicrobiota bacterium]